MSDQTTAMPRPVVALAHLAIRVSDLEASIAFYEQVLDMRQMPRPPFPFPGAWLGVADQALIHLIGGDRGRPPSASPRDTGAIDHVSFWARGYVAQRSRFERLGLPFREACPPETTLAQMFVFDPDAVVLELTYDLREEPDARPGAPSAMPRFDPNRYAQFRQKARS